MRDKKDLTYYEFEVGREEWVAPIEPEWNVLEVVWNEGVVVRNVFNHHSFYNSIIKTIDKYKKEKAKKKKELKDSPYIDTKLSKWEEEYKKVFFEDIRGSLMYYYWSKCEYECIITDFPTFITLTELNRINNEVKQEQLNYRVSINLERETKIDIYQQVLLNWQPFCDYIWNNLKKFKKIK